MFLGQFRRFVYFCVSYQGEICLLLPRFTNSYVCVPEDYFIIILGKDPATKSDDFLEIFQTAFWEIMLQIFYNGYGRIYARRHRPDSIS